MHRFVVTHNGSGGNGRAEGGTAETAAGGGERGEWDPGRRERQR